MRKANIFSLCSVITSFMSFFISAFGWRSLLASPSFLFFQLPISISISKYCSPTVFTIAIWPYVRFLAIVMRHSKASKRAILIYESMVNCKKQQRMKSTKKLSGKNIPFEHGSFGRDLHSYARSGFGKFQTLCRKFKRFSHI